MQAIIYPYNFNLRDCTFKKWQTEWTESVVTSIDTVLGVEMVFCIGKNILEANVKKSNKRKK